MYEAINNEQYRQHALNCGLDMTCAIAVALQDSVGCTVAHTVIDPVYMDRLILSGTTLTVRLVQWLETFGIDYVTVRV